METYVDNFHDCRKQTAAYLLEAARRRLQHETNLCRPSVLLRVTITPHNTDDLQLKYEAAYSGVIAWGDTPELACQAFDLLWQQGE